LQLPNNRAYFPALDGIRAVAFLMVFATHYLQLPWGWAGVNVFFVLSGFLITGILFDTRGQPHRIANFYLRRALRIFPLYYGLVLLMVLLDPIFRWQWSWAWLIWPGYLGNMARPDAPGSHTATLEFARLISRTFPKVQLYLGHLWSLCVEEQFYLVWPWVVFGAGGAGGKSARRGPIAVCAAGIVALPLLRALAGHRLPPAVIDNAALLTVTPLPFDALLLGALIALMRRGSGTFLTLRLARICFAVLAMVFSIWVIRHPVARYAAAPYPYPPGTFTWGLGLIDLLAGSVIVMALERGSLTCRLFSLRPLRWLGSISYGAYVFHDIPHGLIARLFQHYTGYWVLPTAAAGLASTVLCAWASYRWLEGPFIRLKDRWTIRSTSTARKPQSAAPERRRRVAQADAEEGWGMVPSRKGISRSRRPFHHPSLADNPIPHDRGGLCPASRRSDGRN
jgi:peptidoglycan/LPS O-acetylase OafA/YrhL